MDLYNASTHLLHASRCLKEYSEGVALRLLETAEQLLSIVDAPEQKINNEDMDNILNDILNAKE
jgi:hypothetical protein